MITRITNTTMPIAVFAADEEVAERLYDLAAASGAVVPFEEHVRVEETLSASRSRRPVTSSTVGNTEKSTRLPRVHRDQHHHHRDRDV